MQFIELSSFYIQGGTFAGKCNMGLNGKHGAVERPYTVSSTTETLTWVRFSYESSS